MTYDEFARSRLAPLLRYAVMLTGDPYLAEDLVQETLVRVQLKWRRVEGADAPDLYVRRMLTNAFLDWRRADAIMIAHVPTDRSRLYLVTLQRDIEVKLPGRKHARLNQAYEDGGFPLAAQTVTALTGVPFDAGATIEYDGVRRLVGALGGVQLCVDQVVRSEHYDAQGRYHTSTSRERVNPYVHQQGCRQFQPWEAVDYVRQINGLRFGGYDRDRHVAQLFAAILTKATRTVEITDVAAIDGILRAVGDSLVVDTGNIPMNDLVSSVRPALRLDPVEIATPLGGFHSKVIDGRSYQTVDQVTEHFYTALREDRVAAWVAERGTR